MGELTRWQPMVSLYTYFTDCPRKEGGPSMGSVSQYESARSAERSHSEGKRKPLELSLAGYLLRGLGPAAELS